MNTFRLPLLLPVLLLAVACSQQDQSLGPTAADGLGPPSSVTSPLHAGPIIGNIQNDNQDYVGRTIIITDPKPSSALFCGDDYLEYRSVVSDPGGGAIVTTVGFSAGLTGEPGDRFLVTAQVSCNGRLELSLEQQRRRKPKS